MLNRFAAGEHRTEQISVAGRTFRFRAETDQEALDTLDRLKALAQAESGRRLRRIHPRNAGRG